jgi:predicted unusual protein kinase regulating ubiquinone biosynthesis (AarF/ABC1/UbiB family)
MKPTFPRKARTWDFVSRYYLYKKRIDFIKDNTLKKQKLNELGVWTKEYITDLGPTFIKLAQFVSTRKDSLPTEIITQLEYLQDQVPPVPNELIVQTLEAELKENVNTFFSFFDNQPHKTASLGQVHRGVLQSGVEVAVKIQRPGLKELIVQDIDNISQILNFFDLIGINTGPSAKIIFVEAKEYIISELDYRNEANNAVRFKVIQNNLLVVPRVYVSKVTEKVLIMEWVPGIKISNISLLQYSNINLQKTSKELIRIFIDQIMNYGFFHADPHPGNLAISKTGKIILYDYGLVVNLPKDIQENLENIIKYVLERDTVSLVNLFITLEIIIPTTSSKQEIAMFFDNIIKYLEKNSKNFNDTSQKELVNKLSKEKPFLIPISFIFLVKTFGLLEGICKQLDPEFNFIEYLKPYIQDKISINVMSIAESTMEIPSRLKRVSGMVKDIQSQKIEINNKLNNLQNYTVSLLFLEILLNLINIF